MLNVTSNIARIIDELAIFPASESIVFLPVIPQVNYKQADFAKQRAFVHKSAKFGIVCRYAICSKTYLLNRYFSCCR